MVAVLVLIDEVIGMRPNACDVEIRGEELGSALDVANRDARLQVGRESPAGGTSVLLDEFVVRGKVGE